MATKGGESFEKKLVNVTSRADWLVQLVEPLGVTLDLQVVNSSPTVITELT